MEETFCSLTSGLDPRLPLAVSLDFGSEKSGSGESWQTCTWGAGVLPDRIGQKRAKIFYSFTYGDLRVNFDHAEVGKYLFPFWFWGPDAEREGGMSSKRGEGRTIC